MNKNYGSATEAKVRDVVEACSKHGRRSIVALSGVPGTGKSYIASIAAQRFTDEPLLVREVQFHQSFSYEEFMEGLRIDSAGVSVIPGIFLEWNERALEDPEHKYVLLIEEFSRANLPAVLGELLTYLEHRDRPFLTVYSRKPVQVAPNLTVLATYNPTDRSAIDMDAALIRRLRIINCPPSEEQLAEMLVNSRLKPSVIIKLQELFRTCRKRFGSSYEQEMPFGHGIFADIQDEQPDLNSLWVERIQYLLRRPLLEPHPFTEVIEECYPWRNPEYKVP
jgi:5-methylcytosine-specific restriction endonuclease McrBC GTP-binding regulatory subunit McrB